MPLSNLTDQELVNHVAGAVGWSGFELGKDGVDLGNLILAFQILYDRTEALEEQVRDLEEEVRDLEDQTPENLKPIDKAEWAADWVECPMVQPYLDEEHFFTHSLPSGRNMNKRLFKEFLSRNFFSNYQIKEMKEALDEY